MTDPLTPMPELNDAAKAAVADLGIMPKLKHAAYSNDDAHHTELDSLKEKAHAMVEELEKLIGGNTLDETETKKLGAILTRLRGALHGGRITRESLSGLLSEATSILSNAGNGSIASVQTRKDELWQAIEGYNKDIDDDFEKMRNHGVKFSDKLWHRHKELMQYMHDHPHDLKKQKELDAVDDALLLQAEPQIINHPDAKPFCDDAKKKSQERHEAVDKKLAAISNDVSVLGAAFETESGAKGKLTMDDVSLQRVGHKTKAPDKYI